MTAGLLPLLAQAEFGWLETHFVRLVDVDRISPGFAAVAVLTAVVIGAGHALAPGHGKAIAAAYLVGDRGRPRDAIALGAVVAAMHTLSVLVFGGLLYAFGRVPAATATLAPAMTLAAGLLVIAVGVGLLVRHRREHHHHLDDLQVVPPLSRRGLVLLGVSGGLLPSPSAFLVLATAIFAGRVLFGLLLVAAFSVGLAVTLMLFGLAAVTGRDLVGRWTAGRRVSRWIPLAGAVAVVVGGLWITAAGLLRL